MQLYSWCFQRCVVGYEPEGLLRKQVKYLFIQFITYFKNN